MYNGFRTWIQTGNFDLNDLSARMDQAFAMGKINSGEYSELLTLARGRAQPEKSFAPLETRMDQAFALLTALTARVTALESAENAGGAGDGDADEWPEYVQPTGAHDAYFAGAKMTFGGERYICDAPEDVPCVWGPDVMPGYWRKAE